MTPGQEMMKMRISEIDKTWWIAAAILTAVVAMVCVFGCGTAMHDMPGWLVQSEQLGAQIKAAEIKLESLEQLRDDELTALKADPEKDNSVYIALVTRIANLTASVERGKINHDMLIEQIQKADEAGKAAEKGILDAVADAPLPYSGLLASLLALGFQVVRSRGQNAATSKAASDQMEAISSVVNTLQPIVDAQPEARLKKLRKKQTVAARDLVDKIQDANL